ncbi:MAG: hypothetical protein AAF485_32000 [Chloroflexota bacterium]
MTDSSISTLQIEQLQETLGISISQPRLSWQIETGIQNWQQSVYKIRVANTSTEQETMGKVESSQSTLVPWPFAPLQSRQHVSVQMRVWGTNDSETDWSETLMVEAGLLAVDDWSARSITPEWDIDFN